MEIMPHLKLSDELNIKYAILPGDPARVDRIAEQLEQVQPLAYNKNWCHPCDPDRKLWGSADKNSSW